VFSALEVSYDNALYKFTFDIDIDIDLPDAVHRSSKNTVHISGLQMTKMLLRSVVNVRTLLALKSADPKRGAPRKRGARARPYLPRSRAGSGSHRGVWSVLALKSDI